MRVELKRLEDGERFEVQLTKERELAFMPRHGGRVFVERRGLPVSPGDYSI